MDHGDRPAEPGEDQLDELVARLPLQRQVRLLTGATFWQTWDEPAVGLRPVVTSDGPVGVRGTTWDERRPSATLPSPTALAATWDEDLVRRLGGVLAHEARRHGVDVLLAPTVNLHRSPLGGRHFECLSEDPLLTARIGCAYVRGVQAGGVAATAKHYVANDSETERFTLDVRVDERTLRELYLAPFEALVTQAGVWVVMSSYNGVNGAPMSENPLLRDPLKSGWGFTGVVVSDWTAVRSTEPSARAGQDLAMPGPLGMWGDALVAAVRDGRVPAAAVEDKVRRLLRLAARVGALEGFPGRPPLRPDRGQVRGLLREAAAAAMVLVRNTGAELPWDAARLRRVAVLGPGAATARIQGGGSAAVHPEPVVSPLAGLRAALGAAVEVVHTPGVRTTQRPDPVGVTQVCDPLTGEPGVRVAFLDEHGVVLRTEHRLSGRLIYLGEPEVGGVATAQVHARLTADVAGGWTVGVAGIGHYALEVDGAVVLDEVITPDNDDPAAMLLAPPFRVHHLELADGQQVDLLARHHPQPGQQHLTVTLGVSGPVREPAQELAAAVELAAACDVAVVVVGTTEQDETEGHDRASLALPGRQDELVAAVAAVNPRTVVVVNSGGPVTMPWREDVAAVLLSWFPGQEFGDALADVLLGSREPGGRMPTTWAAAEADVPVLSTRPVDGTLDYTEGLHIGYRAWLRSAAPPAYWFGAGLGYTSWAYEALDAPATLAAGADATVVVRVRNTGGRAGREVVQIYLSRAPSSVERPRRWLAGFAAVTAEPGQVLEVPVVVAARAFQHWSVERGSWANERGGFELAAAASAGAAGLTARVEVG